MAVPKYDEMFNPLLAALRDLGGSASIQEQEEAVAVLLGLSEQDLAEIHKGNQTEFSYRLAWTRNYLKEFGLLENSSRGVWALTSAGRKTPEVSPNEVKQFVRQVDRKRKLQEKEEDLVGKKIVEEAAWEHQLLDILRNMPPSSFEYLCQRLLRESGFIQVEVTGRSGDQSIDGRGVVRVGGLISFHMIFQCKRYCDSVGPSEIRDFRGAMVGRAEKGLFITTGKFTQGASQEAKREGAPPIDLIDGEGLVQRLKELRLGVNVTEKVKVVEEISIDQGFFQSFGTG